MTGITRLEWLLGAAVAALCLTCILMYTRLSAAHVALATERAAIAVERQQAAEAARLQADQYRKLETEHRNAIADLDRQAHAQLAAAHVDADTARAAGEQLQHDVDNLVTAVRSAAADCTAAGDCASTDAPVVLLAELQRRADGRAGELAATADDARIRGLACERSYDNARALIERAAKP